MIYMVEVRHSGGGNRLAYVMAEMRTWLDHNRIEPEFFQHSSERSDVVFQVGFGAEDHAAAFAKAFGGQLTISGSEASHPARGRMVGGSSSTRRRP